MKVLLDIKDHKAAFVMELLESLPFVKAKKLTDPKAELMEDIKASVEEVKLAKAGKIKLQSAKDMLNEL
ncbi:hypothetical protein BH09BAC1_BH09BAC1_11600 [soil metagenome]